MAFKRTINDFNKTCTYKSEFIIKIIACGNQGTEERGALMQETQPDEALFCPFFRQEMHPHLYSNDNNLMLMIICLKHSNGKYYNDLLLR